MPQKDNTTLELKVQLRLMMLQRLSQPPVVIETHGGLGAVYERCYKSVTSGAVFEIDLDKATVLALQRPSWSVYEADCISALRAGVGAHLVANVLDVDPYGDPWPTIAAFFHSERPRPPEMFVVVNDGLRNKVWMGGAWETSTLAPVVQEFGNDLYDHYLPVCRHLMENLSARAGYTMTGFHGYYCGQHDEHAHYLAILRKG